MITDDLPDPFDQLVSFGQRPDSHIRPVLLRVLVDMFVNKPHHRPSDLQQFEEMMAHLLDEADDEARLAVADQLSKHAQTPRSLLDRFVAQRGTIAAKVLAYAGMDSRALNAAAIFGTTAMAQAVARRHDIDVSVVRNLAERPENEVLCALIDNEAAPIDRSLFRYLARRAQDEPQLAGRLLERGGPGETVSLFLSAGRQQRADLIASARRQDLGTLGRPGPAPVPVEMLAAIERAASAPGLEGLDVALAAALTCTMAEVGRLMDDPHGEPLAIALAALGISEQAAARIFILGDPVIGHSYEKVKALVGIVATVSPRAANKLLNAMLGRSTDAPRRSIPADTSEPVRRPDGRPAARHVETVPGARRVNGAG